LRSLRVGVAACFTAILFSTTVFHDTRAADLTVRPERVLAVVTSDWNDDGLFDRALLLISDKDSDEVDLLIYLSASGTAGDMRLAVHKRNVAWRGSMWGTQPSLEINDRKSLILTSGNDAVGRNRWMKKLTLVYRDKTFVVAGYTYSERDTLDLGKESSCDVNLLTGGGVRNRKPFKTAAKAVAVSEWSEAAVPRECK
jgi:hypothetical protein